MIDTLNIYDQYKMFTDLMHCLGFCSEKQRSGTSFPTVLSKEIPHEPFVNGLVNFVVCLIPHRAFSE